MPLIFVTHVAGASGTNYHKHQMWTKLDMAVEALEMNLFNFTPLEAQSSTASWLVDNTKNSNFNKKNWNDDTKNWNFNQKLERWYKKNSNFNRKLDMAVGAFFF